MIRDVADMKTEKNNAHKHTNNVNEIEEGKSGGKSEIHCELKKKSKQNQFKRGKQSHTHTHTLKCTDITSTTLLVRRKTSHRSRCAVTE